MFSVYLSGAEGPVVFCLHGAGFTALSWAAVASKLCRFCRVIAFDCRGHGCIEASERTHFEGETLVSDDFNLSADELVQDAATVLKALKDQSHLSFGPEPCPLACQGRLLVVGHSMGGAIAAKLCAQTDFMALIGEGLAGVFVVDVVEGVALTSLAAMRAVLDRRPKRFKTSDAAIEWALSTSMVRNAASARISIPSQLKVENGSFLWRTDLSASEPYWRGWFEKLSETFLNVKAGRVLILAGTDRLDKTLTIGQMQGKFQLIVLPSVGHVIQEDDPDRTAGAILDFCRRYKLVK